MNKAIISGFILWTVLLIITASPSNVLFIGDQAWFYLSARDMILNGEIPLLGITSSHTWIHQGPLWTYMLAPALLISNFNPLSGVYLTTILGAISIFLVYKMGGEFFSKNFGLIFAILYAFSPLVVFHARFAYHTSPIPLFVLLLTYSMTKWVKGNSKYFPLVILSMSVLYNLELATVIFWPVIIVYLVFGIYRKKTFAISLLSKRIVLLSVIALLLPMIPVLIYDVQNGFPQTVVFAGWFVYKLLQFIGIFDKSVLDESSFILAFNFFFKKYEQLTLISNTYVSYLIFLLSLVIPIWVLLKRTLLSPLGVMVSLTLVALLAYFASGVPSEAYLVMLFPGLIFMFAFSIYQIKNKAVLSIIVLTILTINIYVLYSTNFLTKNRVNLSMKIVAVDKILEQSKGESINLNYEGVGEEFDSSSMPYEYLLWWRGDREVSKSGMEVVVNEGDQDIVVEVLDK